MKKPLISVTYRIKEQHNKAIKRKATKEQKSQSEVIRDFAETLTEK